MRASRIARQTRSSIEPEDYEEPEESLDEPEESSDESDEEPEERPTGRAASKRERPGREIRERVATIPHDAMNEQVVIATALVSPEQRARLTRAFLPEHFFGKGHAKIWATVAEIERRGLHYDPATVHALAGDDVDTGYLDALIQQRPEVPPNLAFHVEAMHTDILRMGLAKSGGPLPDLLDALHDPSTDIEQLDKICRQIGGAFRGGGQLKYLRDSDAVFANAVRRKRERRERFNSGTVGYPYGLPGFDMFESGRPRLVPGMAPKQMTLVVGESGSGKTTVTNQIVLAKVNAGRRVLHGAWEQDGEENLEMLAAYSLKIPRTRYWIGDIDDIDDELHTREMDRLRPLITFFELPFDRTRNRKTKILNETNLDVIHEHVERSRCELAIFDLFAKALVETRPEDEKRALDRMLGIAKETDTHLMLLHHLNKADMKDRADRRPTREAIKGSTAWVDAFDTILGLYIPDKWKPGVESNTLEIHILKQRYGVWPIAVEFDYDAPTGVIANGRSLDLSVLKSEDSLNSFLDAEVRGDPPKRGKRRGPD